MKALIIDDEKQAREGVKILLQSVPRVELLGEARDGEEAIEKIAQLKPDLIFLDVQMPGINGFDVLGSIPKTDLPVVIFTTAYDKYALKAFEVQALDYLLKPLIEERFKLALDRAFQYFNQQARSDQDDKLRRLVENYQKEQQENSLVYNKHKTQMIVKSSGKIYFIRTEEVRWIEAMDSYVKIHLSDKTHIVKASLQSLEERYKSAFIRIHRSSLVNMNSIKYLEPTYNGDFVVVLDDQVRLKGSRKYRLNLPEIL